MEADSLFGTLKKYFFADDTKYFTAFKYMISPLKKMNTENCLQIGPNRTDNQVWISTHKIDLRKEEGVIKFLNRLNERN